MANDPIKKFTHPIGMFILKFRWPIILFNILILIGLFLAMKQRVMKVQDHFNYMMNLRNNPLDADPNHVSPPPIMNFDYHVFFEDDNRDMVEYDDFQKIFAKEDNLVIVIKAENGDLFTNENLKSLRELTTRSWRLPYVNRVDGLANFNYTSVDEDDLLVEDFITDLPLSDSLLAEKKRVALNDPIMPHFLISKKGDLTQISLKVVAPTEFPDAMVQAGAATAHLTSEIETGFADFKARIIEREIFRSLENVKYATAAGILEKKLSVTQQGAKGSGPDGAIVLEDILSTPSYLEDPSLHQALLDENKELNLHATVREIVNQNLQVPFEEMVAQIKSTHPELPMNSDPGEFADEFPELSFKPNPNLDIKLGGTVMLNNAFSEYAQKDMGTLFPVMFGLIILFLGVTLRSLWSVITPMLLLLTSIIFPIFLFVGLFERYLTNVSMNTIQMLIAVAIADAVHVLAIFFRSLRNGQTKQEAILSTIDKNFLPCLITSITTAIGFYSLIFQGIPPFVDLGVFSGTGTLYAFFASLFTLPAFLSTLPFKPKKGIQKIDYDGTPLRRYVVFSEWIVKYQKAIRWGALALTAVALVFVFQIHVDSAAVKYFSEDTPFRQASEYIDANILGTNALEFSFKSGETNGIYDPDFLKKIERFSDYINQHPEFHITYVSSIVDVVKRLNQTMNGDKPEFYRIPDRDSVVAEGDTLKARNLIAQYLLLYTMSLPQGMEITNQVNLDNSQARVVAFLKSVSSGEQMQVVGNLNQWLKKEMPEVDARGLGVPVMFGKLMEIAIPGMLVSLCISFIAITIVLMITFRSVRIGLFSMIPNVWPLIIIFGGVGLVGYTVNLSVAVVGMITLGICVDDTVHFIVKYLRAEHQGFRGSQAIAHAFTQVGAPLIFTSIILVVGFGALMFSDFALNSDMGMLCSSVIALALFADFVLLPATILKFYKEEPENPKKA